MLERDMLIETAYHYQSLGGGRAQPNAAQNVPLMTQYDHSPYALTPLPGKDTKAAAPPSQPSPFPFNQFN